MLTVSLPFGINTVFASNVDVNKVILLENYGDLDDDLQKAIEVGDTSGVFAAYIDMIVKLAFGFGSIMAVIFIV